MTLLGRRRWMDVIPPKWKREMYPERYQRFE